jgi:hypothetical protein
MLGDLETREKTEGLYDAELRRDDADVRDDIQVDEELGSVAVCGLAVEMRSCVRLEEEPDRSVVLSGDVDVQSWVCLQGELDQNVAEYDDADV